MKKILVFMALSFSLLSWAGNGDKVVFSDKVYGNVANYFENEADLLGFFAFQKGDVVAEIGAYEGQNIGGFALLTDSITFYAQDINTKTLSRKKFDKIIRRCSKIKKPITSTFHVCIGTEKESRLPDGIFDKIILISTLHEFDLMDEMIADIYKKLKHGGRLYVLENKCLAKTHRNYTADQTIAMMKKHHLTLLKKDGKDLNNSSGLYRAVFGKD